jgi:hypothetical protein
LRERASSWRVGTLRRKRSPDLIGENDRLIGMVTDRDIVCSTSSRHPVAVLRQQKALR